MNLTPDYASVTGGTALVHNGKDQSADIIYLKNSSGNIALNGSGGTYTKLTLNTPLQVGDVITFTSDENSIGSFYLTSSATKNTSCPVISGTYTITDGLAGYTNIYVWNNTDGKFKSITISRKVSITNQPTVATYDVNAANVNGLKFEVSATGVAAFSYQWYSNTTNSTVGGREITTNGTSNTYTPVVTTAGTTYYYCIASAGVLSVTSDVVAVAVLNPSDLKTKYDAAWTPIANGTIDVSNLVTSSSKGAYSITTGNSDVATISGTTITALKAGTFTILQEADDKYKVGRIDITVRIGTDDTNKETNSYKFTAESTDVSDGMTITRKDITMTFGNDGFWSLPSADSYTGGQVNPTVPANNIPTAGTYYKFKPTTTGTLAVKVKLGFLEEGKLRPLYVSESGTLIKAKDKDGTELDPANMPSATSAYEDKITFPVKANTDYYVYVTGSKLGFYGFDFTPVTLYTVTFNAGSNGTCETPSLIQTSEGASITLPSVTANAGYKFDGWYTEATGGTKEGDAGAIYSPSTDITLYARYTATSTGGGETGGSVTSGVISFPSESTSSNESVLKVNTGDNKTGLSVSYGGKTYTNGIKMESKTDISLILTAESNVTFVFDTASKKFKIAGTSYTTGSNGTYTIKLSAGKYTISKDDTSVNLVAVDIQPTGPSLSFTTQPSNKDYAQGVSVSLVVFAAVSNDTNKEYGDVTYQWYSNTTESNQNGTPLDGKNEATLKPSTAGLGTTYYYCVATAAKTADASQKLTATSNVAEVTVSTPTITIITQPQGAVYTKSETATALSVVAKTNFNVNPSYQWYSSTTGREGSFTEISGATNANYTPSIATSGKTYYYCEASSSYTYEGTTTPYSIKSDVVCIEVVSALYKYLVTNETTKPNCNEDRYIENGSEKLVKMTFGGWKWSNNTYTKPGDNSKSITDEWSAPKPQDKVNALDGYEYAISGNNDAAQENKAEKTTMYQKDRYGWFWSPERTAEGITKTSYPFTLPVRGAYMTFEPTQNGILTIYLLQNGAWNTDGNNDIIPGEFRMHAFQITNQRGLVLEEFAPKYSVTCNQKVLGGYSCTKYETDPKSYETSSKDISKWEEFWKLSLDERKAVHDNWKNGTNGSQTIIKLDNGSFLAIQKAIVKYEFHVTGNETYYVFSNFSKLGFSGATFQPDEKQPTDVTTFSGDKSLDETKEYTKITAEQQSTFIDEAKKMYEYKYTIDGTEVGKVSGVFIPQFKDITLKRTFKANQWTTLTLPFNLTQSEVAEIFGEDTRIIMLDKGTNNSGAVRLSFVYHEIQNVLPGYPYLIKPTKEVTTFTVNNKCINPHISQLDIDCGDYIFKGVTDYCTPDAKMENYSVKFDEGDIFVSNGDGKLYISGKESYSKGYRAYIAKKPGTLAAKSISIVMNSFSDDDDTTTSIDMAEFDPTLLESLGLPVGVYNLNGQRVGNDTRNLRPGIYIVNGKKTVVK